MNRKLHSSRQAFTLIEIMVAIVIFAMVVAAVYSTWLLILKSKVVAQSAAARVQRQRIAIRTLEDSLTCIQSFQASMKYYSFNVTNGEQPTLSFTAHLPDIFPRNGRFDTQLRRLTFDVEKGPDADPNEKDLVLRQNPILMDMDSDEQSYPLVLARHVKDFIVECWDTNTLDWVDTWDSTNSIPPLLRITLAEGGNSDDPEDHSAVLAVTREIAVPSTTLPSVVQIGRAAPQPGEIQMNRVARPSSSGMALIVVMIAIAVFSAMAAALAFSMKVETRLAQNADSEEQLLWLGRSGVELARYVLAQEAAVNPYDALNQIWAGGSGAVTETNSVLAGLSLDNYPIGNGTVSLKIIDLDRKVNINTANTPLLQQALTVMGVDADDISVVSDSIQDWIDPDDNPRIAGAETDYYQGLTPPYYAKNAPIDDLSELLLVKGVTPEMYWGSSAASHQSGTLRLKNKLGFGTAPGQEPDYPFGLVDVFTPISSGRININTADLNVLQMLPGVDANSAEAIIKQRAGPDGVEGDEDDTPFQNVQQLDRAGVSQQFIGQIGQLCTTRSLVFEVHVTARIGDHSREFVADIFRNSGTDLQVLNFSWK